MQFSRFSKTKMVSTVKSFHVLTFLIALTACGSHHKDKPAEPCTTGVNGAACSLDVKEHSTWSTQLTSYQSDPQTQKPIPGSERKITVSYEFAPQAANSLWRRSMLIESKDGNTTMFQQGTIKSLSGNKIEFATQQSSCDDDPDIHFANTDFTLYYSRTGGSLQLDDKPIEPMKVKSLGDIFGNIVATAVGEMFRSALESAFTFGSARTYLTSGHGNFSLDPKPAAQKVSAKDVTMGCYSTFGSGFSKSSLQMDW